MADSRQTIAITSTPAMWCSVPSPEDAYMNIDPAITARLVRIESMLETLLAKGSF